MMILWVGEGRGGTNQKNHPVCLVLSTKRKNIDTQSGPRLQRAFNYGQKPNIRHSARMRAGSSPTPSPKIWRSIGCRKWNFSPLFLILRCSAFRICLTLWGPKWTVWPWESFFSQKMPKKQLFGVTQIMITRLWRGITPSILKIETFFTGVSENLGHKLSDDHDVHFNFPPTSG